jgi:signal peptidase II
MRWFLLLTLPFYALDQLAKFLVLRHIGREDEITVVPGFFSLVQVHNTGAAFGMLTDNNLFFVVFSTIFLVALIVFWKRGAFRDQWAAIGAALLMAGILGNVTDRLVHGFVVDFLLFDLHIPYAHPWPAFNIADSCICVAAGLFVLGSLFEKKTAPSVAK